MADNKKTYKDEGIFQRLGKLFQGQIILRKTPAGQVKVKDVNFSQSSLTSNFVDRYSRLMSNQNSNSWGGAYSAKQNAKNAYDVVRKELFREYEQMDQDPIISSALDIYSDESCVTNIDGKILKVKSDNPKVTTILENLFNDIMNIEFNLWPWIRNMTKYGDFYLQLDILDKYGIVNVKPLSVYEVSRMEDHDPEDPTKVQFEIENLDGSNVGKGGDETIKESYEMAHFRNLSDANFLPYGKSYLEGARKVWKQLMLMEDAMLIHRIMRAPEKRIFKLDIGNLLVKLKTSCNKLLIK